MKSQIAMILAQTLAMTPECMRPQPTSKAVRIRAIKDNCDKSMKKLLKQRKRVSKGDLVLGMRELARLRDDAINDIKSDAV